MFSHMAAAAQQLLCSCVLCVSAGHLSLQHMSACGDARTRLTCRHAVNRRLCCRPAGGASGGWPLLHLHAGCILFEAAAGASAHAPAPGLIPQQCACLLHEQWTRRPALGPLACAPCLLHCLHHDVYTAATFYFHWPRSSISRPCNERVCIAVGATSCGRSMGVAKRRQRCQLS